MAQGLPLTGRPHGTSVATLRRPQRRQRAARRLRAIVSSCGLNVRAAKFIPFLFSSFFTKHGLEAHGGQAEEEGAQHNDNDLRSGPAREAHSEHEEEEEECKE